MSLRGRIASAFVLVAIPAMAQCQEGFFDPGFGQGTGRVAPAGASPPGQTQPSIGLLTDSQGRITVSYPSISGIQLLRLDANGSYDLFGPSFNGRLSLSPPVGEQWTAYRARAMGTRYIVPFVARPGFFRTVVVDEWGTGPDPAFGADAGFSAEIAGMLLRRPTLDASSRLLIGVSDDSDDFVAVRMTSRADGLDPAFGALGRRRVGFDLGGTHLDRVNAVALDQEQRLVMAGTVETDTSTAIALLRLTSDGDVDPDFGGGDGKIVLPFPPAEAVAVLAHPDGRYLVVSVRGFLSTQLVLHAVHSNGAVDLSFGCGAPTAGELSFRFAVADAAFERSVAADALVQSDGKLLVAGSAGNTTGLTIAALARFDARGCIDESFGLQGQSFANLDPTGQASSSRYHAVAIGSGGLIGAGEFTDIDGRHIAVAKLQIDPALLPPAIFLDGFEASE